MDLIIENNLNNKKYTNTEIDSFINVLKESLEKNKYQLFSNSVSNELYSEISLASKYKEKFESIINECLKEISYKGDFYYFDYDKQKQEYYLEYYSNGEVERFPATEDDIKNTTFTIGTFWCPFGKDEVIPADYIKDCLKSIVGDELNSLEKRR